MRSTPQSSRLCLCRHVLPPLYSQVPAWMQPLFDSSLTFSTVIAVILTQLLRIGEKRSDASVSLSE